MNAPSCPADTFSYLVSVYNMVIDQSGQGSLKGGWGHFFKADKTPKLALGEFLAFVVKGKMVTYQF